LDVKFWYYYSFPQPEFPQVPSHQLTLDTWSLQNLTTRRQILLRGPHFIFIFKNCLFCFSLNFPIEKISGNFPKIVAKLVEFTLRKNTKFPDFLVKKASIFLLKKTWWWCVILVGWFFTFLKHLPFGF
jgi:hypothetical protein